MIVKGKDKHINKISGNLYEKQKNCTLRDYLSLLESTINVIEKERSESMDGK